MSFAKNRVDSKKLPQNISLESLLKPRSVAVQRGSQREKETQKQLEKELEAQDYIDQFYGQNNIEQDESIPNHVKETLYLALGTSKTFTGPTIIPCHQVMYKYNLGFRDGKYIGSTDDCFQRIVSIGKPAPKKSRTIDADERDLYDDILKMLTVAENKSVSKITSVKQKMEKKDDEKPVIEFDDDDEDIFEDAGTDYVLEARPKSSGNPPAANTKTAYFEQQEETVKQDLDIYLPAEMGDAAKLSHLLQNSHKIKQPQKENNDGDSSDSQESIHMLEDIPDAMQDTYGHYYDDDSDEEEEGPKVTESSKLNQELQKMDKVYKNKFGEGLRDEPQSKKRNLEDSSKEKSLLKKRPKKN